MENTLCEDLQAGYYRIDEKIKNLRIKIRVRKINNACFSEQNINVTDTNELELMNLMQGTSDFVEQTFSWQEKVDKNESHKSGTKDNITDCTIVNLFTYIDSEIISTEYKHRRCHTCPASKPNVLEQRIMKRKPRPRLQLHENETWQKPLGSDLKQIVKTCNTMRKLTFSAGKLMVIMAALFFEDSLTEEEIELCFLHVDDYGTLSVIPDFHSNKPFTFLNSRSETFEYYVENVSIPLTKTAVSHETYFLKKIEAHRRKMIGDSVGNEFIMPSSDDISFYLNFEIVSARNFGLQDIFVRYLIILPKESVSVGATETEGVTQTCKSKRKTQDTVAYFGYIFNLDICLNMKNLISLAAAAALKIIIEVTSVDNWGNFRNEGYGHMHIMLIPGINITEIHTWKLEPTTLRNRLENFFIGGTPCLDDLTYIAIPNETKGSQLSKYGARTITSGTITLQYCIIQQRKQM